MNKIGIVMYYWSLCALAASIVGIVRAIRRAVRQQRAPFAAPIAAAVLIVNAICAYWFGDLPLAFWFCAPPLLWLLAARWAERQAR